MNTYQGMVEAFHRATDSTIRTRPELTDCELRAKLILEEAIETVAAMGFSAYGDIMRNDGTGEYVLQTSKSFDEPDFPEIIDGLCDLLYVTFGSAVSMGIDLDPFFHEVHATNMAKLAGEKRADGKQLKPEGWRPPRIALLLEDQITRSSWVHERDDDLMAANG